MGIYNTSSRLRLEKTKKPASPSQRTGGGGPPKGGPLRSGIGSQQRIQQQIQQNQLAQQQMDNDLTYTEYPLSSTARHGRQNHLMDFKHSKKVQPKNFARPVKLHRRETNRIPYGQYIQNLNAQNAAKAAAVKEAAAKAAAIMNGTPLPESSSSSKAKDDFSEAAGPSTPTPNGKEQHGPKTGADTSLIAPLGGATRNKQMLFKKRTKQIYLAKEDTRELKEQEHRPWILEDYDCQNSFQGTLEGGQRSEYMFFVLTTDGFRVMPVDRWYKFQAKRKFQTLSLEEAEEHYKKQTKRESGRWMMLNRGESGEAEAGPSGSSSSADRSSKFKLVDHDDHNQLDDDEGKNRHDSDMDDLDFDDVFQDDDEAVAEHEVEDEDVKDSKDRVKKEIKDFAIGSNQQDDEELFDDSVKLTSEGKQMRKLVRDLEKNRAYESDEEGDPYASSAEELDSDADDSDKEDDEKDKEKDQDVKKSANIPLKKKPVAAPSKQVMPKKAHTAKVKKEGLSKPIGRPGAPGAPSIYMQKKAAQREQQAAAQRDGSTSPKASTSQQRPASPPTSTFKKPSSPVRPSSPLNPTSGKQHTSPTPSSPPSSHHHKESHVKKRKNEEQINGLDVKQRRATDELITEREVIDTLRGRTMTTKEFLMSFKRRIKSNDQNRGIITDLLKKVAKRNTSGDPNTRMLELRPEYQ